MADKAQLMIDGDHAIALLGPDLQVGECVCVQVEAVEGSRYTADAQRRAAQQAIEGLRTKVKLPHLAYTLDPSHPDFGVKL